MARSDSGSSGGSSSPKPPASPNASSAPDLSILGDQVSLHPTGFTGTTPDLSSSTTSLLPGGAPQPYTPQSLQAQQQHESPDHNLVEGVARFRQAPFEFLRELSSHVSGHGWRSYDNVVGQPVFYAGFSEQMKARVTGNPMLKAKIRELAAQRVEVEDREEGRFGGAAGEKGGEKARRRGAKEKERRRREVQTQLEEVVEGMTDDMICKMESKRFIRGAYYLCAQILTRAYHQGIHVNSEEVLRLRAVAEKAERDKHSIIFLPCHRSHVDYVSLQLICYRLGLALPTVVAGDNLNFPLVGQFLQHAGAFWIRRSFGDDQLYQAVVQSYMDALLTHGYNFECFVEGGRSRTGKLLPPKFGILSFLLDSVLSGRVDDAIICPVSTQYDKVIEVDSYISELLGQPKPKENLRDFLSASSVLSLKLGRVDVRFAEPWSLRSFINAQQARASRLPPAIGPAPNGSNGSDAENKEFRLRLLRTLGYRVLSEINAVSVVMPTALVGTVLLTLRGRGVGKSELVRRVEWLGERVRNAGGRVAHFGGAPTEYVVERALDVLGPGLVGSVAGLPEETFYAVDRFQLSFYRNMTIHLFILPALVSAAMYTRVKQGGAPSHQRISYADLYEQVAFLSQLFRGEFIFPTEGLATNLDKTLRSLEADRVIKVTRVEREDANDQEGAPVQWVELSDEERERGRENYDFYCFMIWPFVEASWLGAVSLMMLTPPPPEKSKTKDSTATTTNNNNPWLDQKKVQDRAQLLGKTLYHQGDLSYFEAVNKETLKNAYTRFEEDGIIAVSRSRDSRVPPTLRLADDWVPLRDPATGHILPKGRLWDFAEMISQSRREGKNRRDGKTVVGRVLGLVEKVGAQLFVDGAVSGSTKVLLEGAKVAEVGVSAKQKGEALERAEEEAAAVAESERRKRRRKSIQTRARL
ncbi:Glycerol-3-phosphate acyltransferase [Lasiodiplodia hormozganensis]|uniref:Glycerol-3-phosphate acyltransferase n=1 Tax=Lasiodiplodia hormozganensis TaxID=869390 RepID=A0AA40C593_9PEZI|nr:Glycerol-3-phosphate acyltransferase [Lasiodiplodia hormozganensis]